MGARLVVVARTIARGLVLCAKLLWVASMVVVPLVGMWLSSSLAAYHNHSILLCIAFGLLLFPVVPLVWDRLYLWRTSKRTTNRARVLTGTDRLILRTLLLNIAFIVGILSIAPSSAFRAISTRGDWMFDGYNGAISTTARRIIFDVADVLEGRWQRGKSVYGKSDAAPDAPNPDVPNVVVEAERTSDTPEAIEDAAPVAVATAHWPLEGEIHTAVSEMPESVQGSYQEVAKYLERRFDDPFERVRAVHDYITLRLTYDYEQLRRIEEKDYEDMASQQAEAVFAARTAVCEGYARLMRAMGEEAGLEIAYIVGNARFLMEDAEGAGHAWNAAKVDGRWYLIDVTWDDGQNKATGEDSYKTTYLNTPPELFGVDHFPDDPKWQLRSPALSVGEFMRQPDVSPDFALYGFELIEPRRSQVTVSGNLHMTIANPKGAFMLATWNPKDAKGRGQECEVRNGDPIEVVCDFKKDGEYLVTLFANREQYGQFGDVAKQLVNKR